MKVDTLGEHSPPPCRVDRLGGQLLANVEQRDATTLRRAAHEVHEAARAKGPGEKRHNAGLAHGSCGACWRAGRQLAWLTAKIEPSL